MPMSAFPEHIRGTAVKKKKQLEEMLIRNYKASQAPSECMMYD